MGPPRSAEAKPSPWRMAHPVDAFCGECPWPRATIQASRKCRISLPASCAANKRPNSIPSARSRGSDRCACQNRRWFLRSSRGFYSGWCQRGCLPSPYEGITSMPAFLCGISGMRWQRGFSRRILAARIRPPLGSTCNFMPIIFGTRHCPESQIRFIIFPGPWLPPLEFASELLTQETR